MEAVSKFYIKVDKADLLESIKSVIYRHGQVEELLGKLENYERNNNISVDSFYLCVVSSYFKEVISAHDLSVKQDSILNAYLQSLFLGNTDVSTRLSLFLKNERASYRDLGCDLYNYVLGHSMSFDEFINGEEEQLLYDDDIGDFAMGCIRDPFGKPKTKKKTN
jgi:hypothetical protein